MDLVQRIKEYFEKVSDEEFLRAAKEAGITLVPEDMFYKAEHQGSLVYGRPSGNYILPKSNQVFSRLGSDQAA